MKKFLGVVIIIGLLVGATVFNVPPAHATVAVTTVRNDYAGAGTTGPFTYAFKIWTDSDLLVIKTDANGTETVLTLNVDYTVTGAGVATGGTITTTDAVPTGSTITLMRAHPYLQSQNWTSGQAITALSLNNVADKLSHQIQQLAEASNRSFQLPRSSTGGPIRLGPAPSHIIGWDAAGLSLRNYATTAVQSASIDTIGNYGDDLATAVSVIGSGVQDLWIDKAITLTGDVIVPKNITLHVLRAGRINGTYNLSIGNLVAGRWQIFGMGATKPTVSFEPGAVEHGYYPEWWGADPTGATDSGAALEEMIAAIKRGGVGSYGDTPYIQAPVSLAPKATYLCQRGLFPGQSPTDGVGVYGVEGHGARIIFENVAGSCKVAWDLTGKKFGYLHDVTFQGGIPNSDQFPVYSNPPEILVLMSRPWSPGGGANGHHWYQTRFDGAATVAGVYNYASEGWHVSDTTFWLASPAPVVITKSNFLGYTIPHEWGGAYAPLGSESCIEFLFERVNFFNTTLTGLSNPNTFCSLLVESASMTKIDHCEIGASYVADIPLVRLVSGYVNAAFMINNFQITNTTFHPAQSVITLPILPSGNVTTTTDYKYGVYFQHGGAGTLANFRRVNLDQNTWNGSTSADIIAEENVRLYRFRTELTSGILDLSASGCGVYDDSSIWIGATATIHVDSELRGALYMHSGATVTFDDPAKVFAKIWVTDNGGALGSEATVTHNYGATATAYTLTPVDLAQLGTLRLTNASGAADCIVPAGVIKTFNVLNISGKTITIKYAGSTGVSIAHNKRAMLLADGAEIKEILAAY